MALDTIRNIETQIDKAIEAARERGYAIQRDPAIAPPAKHVQVQELDRQKQDTMARLTQELQAAILAERRRLQRTIFRKPVASRDADQVSMDMNYRSALDVAGRAEDEKQLREITHRAALTGDEVLRQATLVVAVEHGWTSFLQAEATGDRLVAELLEFEQHFGPTMKRNTTRRVADRLFASASISADS